MGRHRGRHRIRVEGVAVIGAEHRGAQRAHRLVESQLESQQVLCAQRRHAELTHVSQEANAPITVPRRVLDLTPQPRRHHVHRRPIDCQRPVGAGLALRPENNQFLAGPDPFLEQRGHQLVEFTVRSHHQTDVLAAQRRFHRHQITL
jgi:hypothetical protein